MTRHPARRILIADDHAAVRRGIRRLLESHSRWTVCAEAADGIEAIELARRFRPDVVILDISMPKLNGLEAARQLTRVVPHAHLVVLTMHVAEHMIDEVRRAGVTEVILKSQAYTSLIPAIESLPASPRTMHLGGSVVDEHRHIAAFFDSERERDHVLAPFIADGLAAGEKALHLIDAEDHDRHLHELSAHGIDVRDAEAQRRLELRSWHDTYLREGEFNRHAMTTLIETLLTDAVAEGFPSSRVIANMEWALEDKPGVNDLVDYEAQLNHVLPKYPDVVICTYDITKFSVQTIIGVIAAHPAVLIGGELHENPFYVRPRSA